LFPDWAKRLAFSGHMKKQFVIVRPHFREYLTSNILVSQSRSTGAGEMAGFAFRREPDNAHKGDNFGALGRS
jgi:hypothetical protein